MVLTIFVRGLAAEKGKVRADWKSRNLRQCVPELELLHPALLVDRASC